MRLLVLGGTVFLGRAVARHARDVGHDVTCAARGVSGTVPDGVRLVRVDRDRRDGLSTLDG
jgi:2'-hydroxyisoflavone reductase